MLQSRDDWPDNIILEEVVDYISHPPARLEVMTQARDRLAAAFADRFSHWRIRIPRANVAQGTSGSITKQGWLIQYGFGLDAGAEYLDYYAAHRMTDDSHMRLHADGREEWLPAINGMFLTSDDPTEARRLAQANQEHNRAVHELLVAKGFDKMTINMALRAGLEEESE